MLGEFRASAHSEKPWFLAPTLLDSERSGRRVAVLRSGRNSLAVSPDQLRVRLFELGKKLVVGPANTAFFETPLHKSLFPLVIDRESFEADHLEIRRLEFKLIAAFEETHLEDGINHPAEQILHDGLQSANAQDLLTWFRALVTDIERPFLASAVLRVLGRCRPGTSAWRAGTVRAALVSDDVEIRDAAVQAAESWGGSEIREVLQGHLEPTPWLRTYIDDVIEDLGD